MIFCFGSNLAGKHGKGAALEAVRKHGARYGEGVGRQGNSYAIPTKGHYMEVLSLEEIAIHIGHFMTYATENPDLSFNLTPIGTGLAGYRKSDMVQVIRQFTIPDNVYFNKRWFQE